MSNRQISHDQLVSLGARWLKKHQHNIKVPNCATVLVETVTATNTGEIPDIIGWCSWTSVLIEVKISRGDFLKDLQKPFRIDPSLGVGDYRYYLVPDGLISEKDVPVDWGLLLFDEKKGGISIKKVARKLPVHWQSERAMLLSFVRRASL